MVELGIRWSEIVHAWFSLLEGVYEILKGFGQGLYRFEGGGGQVMLHRGRPLFQIWRQASPAEWVLRAGRDQFQVFG